MFFRSTTGHTLGTLHEALPQRERTSLVDLSEMEVSLAEDPAFRWRTEGNSHEVPVSDEGLQHMCAQLNVPWKFLERQNPEFREVILNGLIGGLLPGLSTVRYDDDGLHGFNTLEQAHIPYRQIIETIGKVMPESSKITSYRLDAEEFTFDAIVPEGFDRGWGGDSESDPTPVLAPGQVPAPTDPLAPTNLSEVGDLTAGGLRVGYMHSKGHAPFVQPFQYRLACTNGMENADVAIRMDARNKGMDVDGMLDHLETLAGTAFAKVENEIAAFYDLRNERIANPEQVIARMAQEHNLSNAVSTDLVRLAGGLTDASMFDIVNLITNSANDPRVKPRKARGLQLVAGAIVSEHVDRCTECSSRVG